MDGWIRERGDVLGGRPDDQHAESWRVAAERLDHRLRGPSILPVSRTAMRQIVVIPGGVASGPSTPKSRFRPTALAFLELNRSLSREATSPADICRCSRLLHLMVHSVYSDRELFVREVVLKPSRPGWQRPPSHPTRCLGPAPLGREPARRGFRSAAARPDSSNPAIPESVRSPLRA